MSESRNGSEPTQFADKSLAVGHSKSIKRKTDASIEDMNQLVWDRADTIGDPIHGEMNNITAETSQNALSQQLPTRSDRTDRMNILLTFIAAIR
jgi:hypothetical protein